MGFYPFVLNAALTNPMTAAGDLIDGGAAGTPQRLAIGPNGDVLTVVAGAPAWSAAGAGSGTVTSVAATDASIVVSGTPTVAPTIATGTLDVIATQHPPAASWSNNSNKITSLENGSAASDAAAFGQIPSWLNVVTAYGADPTGTNDSTTAIQNALNAGGGGVVYIPVGTYKINSATLNPPMSSSPIDGIIIRGDGWGSVLEFDQSLNPTLIAASGTTQGKVDIRDIRIVQSGAADGGTAINGAYFVNSLLENISIDGGANGKHCNTGITLNTTGTYYNEIRGCRVSVNGTGAQGIVMTNVANSNTAIDCRVVVNSAGGTSSNGFYIDAHSCTLIHPDVEVGPGNGINVDASGHACTIVNPYLEGMNVGLLLASGVANPVVIGGAIEGNTTNLTDNGSVNPFITGAWENSGSSQLSSIESAGNVRVPADGGLIAWTYDPAVASNISTVTGGVMYLAKITIRYPCTITNLWFYLSTAIGGATAGENFILLYNAAGTTLLGSTATTAIDTAIGTSGFISHAMSSTYAAAPGEYWIGVLFGTASSGALARASGSSLLGSNLGLQNSASAWYQCDGTTGLASTTPPSSVASFVNTNAAVICVGCS